MRFGLHFENFLPKIHHTSSLRQWTGFKLFSTFKSFTENKLLFTSRINYVTKLQGRYSQGTFHFSIKRTRFQLKQKYFFKIPKKTIEISAEGVRRSKEWLALLLGFPEEQIDHDNLEAIHTMNTRLRALKYTNTKNYE